MRYPIAIEVGNEGHAYGVAVPDLPGCFSAGDTLDEAMINAKEAIQLHLEDLMERGEGVPVPRPVEVHYRADAYPGWVWAYVDINDADTRDKAVRLNITLPQRLLEKIDAAATENGYTRSGLLAEGARVWLDRENNHRLLTVHAESEAVASRNR